jgi:hypothetical protein
MTDGQTEKRQNKGLNSAEFKQLACMIKKANPEQLKFIIKEARARHLKLSPWGSD